jgi:hypothetical protein
MFSVAAQTWKTVQIDSSVSVKLPFAYTTKDTLGQKIITSRVSYGDVQILVTPDNPMKMPDIEKKKHLLKYYNSYVKKVKASSAKGNITNQDEKTIGNLFVKDFTLEVDSGRGKQIRDFRILHENGATYTFQLLYQGIHTEYMAEERDQFFNSIHVADNPPLKSQFTDNPDGGSSGNKLIYIGGGILLLLIIIFLVIRSRKRRTDPD